MVYKYGNEPGFRKSFVTYIRTSKDNLGKKSNKIQIYFKYLLSSWILNNNRCDQYNKYLIKIVIYFDDLSITFDTSQTSN